MALLTQDGRALEQSSIRAKDGAVTDIAGGITFPPVGQRGAFVMEFPRPDALGTFSIAANDEPLLSAISLHFAVFRSF